MARLNARPHPSESPMDFDYDDGRGPVEADSPFIQNPATGLPWKDSLGGQKRTVSALDSPTKPSLPALRKPEGQTWLFSPPSSKDLPEYRAPAFTTPRRPTNFDFTSGDEQSSPVNGDSENTPDPPARLGMSTKNRALVTFEGDKSTRKGSSSPIQRLRSYTDMVTQKVKRRRRNADNDVRGATRRKKDTTDQDMADGGKGADERGKTMAFVPSVLSFIDAHPGLPNTLSIYVQFFLNCFFAFCIIYVLWGAFTTIRHDIDEKAMMESSEILAEMAVCAREFQENRCERHTRVPAMETVCNSWEKCMQRDPYKVGRSRLSAGMFAEIFNGFVEPISIKAIIVSISIIVGCFAVNNITFGLFRARTQVPPPAPQHMYMHQPQQQQQHQPHQLHQQQHQQQIGYQPSNEHFYTPFQYGMGMQGSHQGGFAIEAPSPSKRAGYRHPT